MADDDDEDIPTVARPVADELGFDLDGALAAVVTVRAQVPPDAFTAKTLGTERRGNGVIIDKRGLVLTIGYLVTEAEQIWVTSARHGAAPGHVLAYDQGSGFGLVQLLGRLDAPALPLGKARDLELGATLIVAGGRGRRDALSARLVGRRRFAGYWEYLIEGALFTAPAHPHWGGAACIDEAGRLVGIGSLLVQEAGRGSEPEVGNMVVPVDLLEPVLPDLMRYGRPSGPPRPWLGLYAADTGEGVVVTGTAPAGPAARGGIEDGDLILGVDGQAVGDLGDLWRVIWAAGAAGVAVRLQVSRDGREREIGCVTADRGQFLRQPRLH